MPAPFPSAFPASRLRLLAHSSARSGGRGAGHGRAGEERCDLCSESLPEEHRHLLDLRQGAVSCACRACSLLFDRQEAGGSHYRLLPRRRLRLDGCEIDDALWAGLGVPVGLAFFTRAGTSDSTRDSTPGSARDGVHPETRGEVTAGYPSPLGVLRSTVDPHHWREVEASHPALPAMADDVEALLVNRAEGAREHWIVPLDDCYRLVAVVRARWKGLGGGPEVRQHIEDFFHRLSTDSRPETKEASWPVSP
ncbi:MAG TPA: DUF5947 family protein [Streptomyces sp.]|nr:DUF5947 family protein [Streptomyces sp.]